MNLQDHTSSKTLRLQATRHTNHGDLDDVRGTSLHGMIHGRALTKTALDGIFHLELGDMAPTTEHSLGITCLLCLLHHAIQEHAHARICLVIAIDHLTGLGHRNIERLRKPVGLLAIHDAKVNGFGAATQLRRHLIDRHAKHA